MGESHCHYTTLARREGVVEQSVGVGCNKSDKHDVGEVQAGEALGKTNSSNGARGVAPTLLTDTR